MMTKEESTQLLLSMAALLAMIVVLCVVLTGCAPRKYIYRVTFTDGNYDYYELNYKPKADSKAIEYDGETILGVQKIERVE